MVAPVRALRVAHPADLLELTKPRIVALVMMTAAAGFYVAVPGVDVVLLAHTLLGTALVAGGTSALNQVWERETDALMRRTARRPIPSGRVTAPAAATFALVTAGLGVGYLAVFVNALTAALAALTLASYVLLYTPLKRRTSLATLAGAVPGALPILGGWAAAAGTVDARAWALFWIVFLWQLPHFLALAWLYRDDYGRAGFAVLGAPDADGRATFLRASLYAVALVPMSLVPAVWGVAGRVYFIGAGLLSAWLAWASFSPALACNVRRARRLFLASIVYLPAVLALLVLDKAA